jgi:hypothetical protein
MDWSDEYFANDGENCPFTFNTMECDEHLCYPREYSCGDGECVQWRSRMAFQRIFNLTNDCFSKRNLNYMCEVSKDQPTWTLKNGLCWPDRDYDDPRYPPWNIIQLSNLTNGKKCDYVFRCMLSDNFERDCPCQSLNCTQIMINVCSEKDPWVLYPPPRLFTSNILIAYNYRQYKRNTNFGYLGLGGNLKCRGFLSETEGYLSYPISQMVVVTPHIQQVLCSGSFPNYIKQDAESPFKINKFCWNGSLTFNGRPYAVEPNIYIPEGQCISQYRIQDGTSDCLLGDDETKFLGKSYCTDNVGKQRFQCYNHQNMCLTSNNLGTGTSQCSNSYDESWYGSGLRLSQDLPCESDLAAGCNRVKEYVQQSSLQNANRIQLSHDSGRREKTTRIAFH